MHMQHPSRRDFLGTAGLVAGGLALSPLGALRAAEKPKGFTLPPLPYPFDALEDAIDARTMEIHHDKHHAAYVKNLNDALKDHPEFLSMSIEDLMRNVQKVPEPIRPKVINNGGGHLNHSMFWLMMAPRDKRGEPGGELLKAIESDLGGGDKFKQEMTAKAVGRFGSGWAWLTYGGGKLHVIDTLNQNCPYLEGQEPLLGVDVWEHAYYLRYQNRRPEYVQNWWKVVNWNDVAERFNEAKKRA
jgi:Fe-Mn family superoxide dismutase